MKELKESTYF